MAPTIAAFRVIVIALICLETRGASLGDSLGVEASDGHELRGGYDLLTVPESGEVLLGGRGGDSSGGSTDSGDAQSSQALQRKHAVHTAILVLLPSLALAFSCTVAAKQVATWARFAWVWLRYFHVYAAAPVRHGVVFGRTCYLWCFSRARPTYDNL